MSGLVAVCLFQTAGLVAQPQVVARVATSVPALLAFPGFYHLKPVVVRGEISSAENRRILLPPGGDRGVDLLFKDGKTADGLSDVRGQFWDVGRMTTDDPRLAGYNTQAFLDAKLGGRWPAPGDALVIGVADATPAAPAQAPTIRTIVLDPGRYEGQTVTVSGEFRGNNLFGDLPRAPKADRWDFVLRSAGAALWITGIRPRGKGFDLDTGAKVDTGRLVEATGVVKTGNALVWIEATEVRAPAITAVRPQEEPPEPEGPPPPPLPPPEVVFSLPAEGESEVSPSSTVRFQVTRNLDPATLKDNVLAAYVGAAPPGGTPPAALELTASYSATERVLQIRFAQPLERFRTVKIELLDSIKGTDGQPLKPFTLTFTTGSG